MTDGTGTPALRTVEIAGPSTRAELTSIIRLAMAIAALSWLYIAVTVSEDAQARRLLPFQRVALDMPPAEQRMFRELRVGFIEALNIRSATGSWPSSEALADQGIEPFADDPTRKDARYGWRLERDRLITRYVGIPDREGPPKWLVLVQEPDPALPPEPDQNDEEHARLLDGTQVHASIWRHEQGRADSGSPRSPQLEGWTQIFGVGPSATH